MGHLEGNFTPVLYIGRKVPKGYYDMHRMFLREGLLKFTSASNTITALPFVFQFAIQKFKDQDI